MAKDVESTVQWKLDIAQLKKGMQDARREISLANAEFKNATAGMDKWANSVTGVEAKTTQLTKVLDGQKKILGELQESYNITVAEMGEASPEAQRLKIQIENQEAAIKKTESQLDTYNDKLQELQAEQEAAQSPINQLSNTIDEQENALEELKRQYAGAIVGNAPQDAERLAREIQDLSGELRDNKARMSEAENAADELDQSLEDAGEGAADAANGGFTVLKGALANLISDGIQRAIGFVSDLVDDAIAASDALQKFEGTMGFAGFDDAHIQEARQAVQDYADATVYDLETIANTTAQLAANGVEDYTGLTQAAGNLNAVAGGNAETFNSLAMMLTQTAGAGKLTTENWNQLADAIPGASGVLQDALRENGAFTGDFREAMAAGEITADEFNEALMQLGTDPVAVEAATSVSTFEGAMGNLEATVVNGLMSIYEQIGSETITGFITSISDTISELIPYIQSAVQFVLDNKDAIIAALAGIAAGLTALSIVQTIQKGVEAFTKWKTATEGMTVAQRALNLVMAANPIGIIVTLIAAVVAALVTLYMTNEDFRAKVLEIWGNVKEFVGGAIEAIKNFFTVTLPDAIKNMLTWFQKIPERVGAFIGNALAKVTTWAGSMRDRAVAAGKNFLSNVVNFISQLPGRVWSFLSNVVSKVASWGASLASKGRAAAVELLNAVVNKVKEIPGKVASVGGDLVKGIWNGISGSLSWIKGKITGWVGNVTDFLKSLFGIASPSKVMRDEVGKMLARGIGLGFEQEMPATLRTMQDAMSGTVDALRGGLSVAVDGTAANAGNGGLASAGGNAASAGNNQTVIFNQYNQSPKALDRLTIYRDTKSLLFSAKVGLNNV